MALCGWLHLQLMGWLDLHLLDSPHPPSLPPSSRTLLPVIKARSPLWPSEPNLLFRGPTCLPQAPCQSLGHKWLGAAYLGDWVEVVLAGFGRVGRSACWGAWRMAVLETDSGRMVAVVGDRAPSVG